MAEVWKVALGPSDWQGVALPQGARILHFGCQRDVPTIWALVDPATAIEVRQLRLVGTGHPFDVEGLAYVGTTLQLDGDLVWHLFEVTDG